ncbi:MAG: cadmium-translocating P-type ATPase [Parvibaculaceae bacterium]|nr:cadmium-translocating P-type ATPase [Parvibaculaceae bacterium]
MSTPASQLQQINELSLAPSSDANLYARLSAEGIAEMDLIVPGMHCAGCLGKVERGLGSVDGILYTRANLSTKRVKVKWHPEQTNSDKVLSTLSGLGFEATPFDTRILNAADSEESKRLLRAVGVAGFAAANVMLLSVSVWSGLVSDMDEGTRGFFHWLSALIALPAIAYSGQVFFKSAFNALRHKQMNMDVPIALAVILASAMSLSQAAVNAEHVYFDASISLLFFLLIGRYLDVAARQQACSVAQNLLALRAQSALCQNPDGTWSHLPLHEVKPGMRVMVAAGQHIPVDADVLEGSSSIDASLVTGETMPVEAQVGEPVFAGTLNMDAPLVLQVTKAEDDTLLAEIVRLMEAAEQARAGYVRLADRISQAYAPAVHILSAITFLGWVALGAGWHTGLINAIAVLIITCPCALGLAVPVVQVVASGRLLKQGVLIKSPDGLEKLAQIDTVIFDKTGTLTLGQPVLLNPDAFSCGSEAAQTDMWQLAFSLAQHSAHPLSKALVRATHENANASSLSLEDVQEVPGQGLHATWRGKPIYLGKQAFMPSASKGVIARSETPTLELWFEVQGNAPICLHFADALRPNAAHAISQLIEMGLKVELLSGDLQNNVEKVATELNISNALATQSPADKIAHVQQLTATGRKILMVGDGLNDAPALKTAFVSMSPASASDISQTAADFIFQNKSLSAVPETIKIARKADALVKQNFGLAFLYNAVAIPLAMMGYVTPLIAAIAMSTSSLTVICNAMRLNLSKSTQGTPKP